MKNCKHCKHWVYPDVYSDFGLGVCNKIPMFWDATEWNDDYDGRKLKEKYADIKAFTQDGSDYMAVLKTFPDFGCVMFEK